MVKRRPGASRLGCLFGALLLVTVAYFGVNVGQVYLRYYRFRDAMEQEARFSHTHDDAAIRLRLTALADSMGLPETASRILIRRSANSVIITTDYTERVEMPLLVREIHFAPRVEWRF